MANEPNSGMPVFRKGQAVYLVKMGRDGLYEVVAGTIVRTQDKPTDDVLIRYEYDYEGERQKTVMDQTPDKVFRKLTDAAWKAIKMCGNAAARWNSRKDNLIEQFFGPAPK